MRIVSLTGALGYGFSEEALQRVLEQDVALIGVDGGSTDPGPHYLGAGKVGFTRESLKRDLEIGILAALGKQVPFVVGSSGLAGGAPHLKFIETLVDEIAEERDLRFRLALIHTELDKEYLKAKLRDGKIVAFSDQIELTEESIDASVRIVGQVGIEPFVEALEAGADVILAGRACDTAIFAALPISKGYPAGLAFHMAKIIECGAMCAYPTGLDVVVAEIFDDHFTLEPGSPDRKCTVERVAGHTLYEQASPIHIHEPHGVADLSESRYEQLTERSVKVSNSSFIPAETKTIKIEGAKLVGFRTICIGGSNEPLFVTELDAIVADTKRFVAEQVKDAVAPGDYTLNVRVYGGAHADAAGANRNPTDSAPRARPDDGTGNGARRGDLADAQLGIVIDVVGRTQAVADYVLATARGRMMHFDYPGRKSTAGNLACPYSPSDLSLGPVYEFSAYHLVTVDDFSETCRIEYRPVGR